jgi:chromosome segregation ATPase
MFSDFDCKSSELRELSEKISLTETEKGQLEVKLKETELMGEERENAVINRLQEDLSNIGADFKVKEDALSTMQQTLESKERDLIKLQEEFETGEKEKIALVEQLNQLSEQIGEQSQSQDNRIQEQQSGKNICAFVRKIKGRTISQGQLE